MGTDYCGKRLIAGRYQVPETPYTHPLNPKDENMDAEVRLMLKQITKEKAMGITHEKPDYSAIEEMKGIAAQSVREASGRKTTELTDHGKRMELTKKLIVATRGINRINRETDDRKKVTKMHARRPERGPRSESFIQDMFTSTTGQAYQGRRNNKANDPLQNKRYPRQKTDVTMVGY
mmetsp:Transcript_79916/g.227939  ORF Transcript_79916/g.227939 Transcript_79916/m.227939 type:complete len:177 (-) Transcript_79916:44-574(-)